MKFSGPIDQDAQKQIDEANTLLCDPARLECLRQTGLMDSPQEEAFDRLARIAAKVLHVPLTIVSLVSDKKQFFKAGFGLPPPMDVCREIPIDGSICRYTLKGKEIIAGNAMQDPLLMYHPATGPWGIGAFIAIPMITEDGYVLGAFCAVDVKERPWSETDIELMRELTESVMTEISLRRQIAKLNVQTNLRETFVAALTHDLRTPLSTAKLTAQYLAKKFPDLDIKKNLDRIDSSLVRADEMIRNLLDANHLSAGQKLPLFEENFDLVEKVKSIIEGARNLHGNRFALETADSVMVSWDPNSISRIFENLLSNAIKYGAPKSNVTVRISATSENVKIEVHNLGPPIKLEDQAIIFEPFHRTVSAIEGRQTGWGIGLPLVRGLVDSHGGTVEVVSDDALGTTFIVNLPKNTKSSG